jgi:hypothetical protein
MMVPDQPKLLGGVLASRAHSSFEHEFTLPPPPSREDPEITFMKKLSNDDRSAIGKRLQLLVHAGQSAKGDLPIRWQANEAFFDNGAPQSNDSQAKIVKLHVNFLSIRVNSLTSMVCGVLARQEPYMIARDMQNGDRADRLEQALHFFWQRAGFEQAIRKASTVAANTNKAIWKLSYRPYDDDKSHKCALNQTGLVMEVIHPDNWVCVPASPDGLQDAKLCGNRFWRRRRWVTDRISSGEFLSDDALEDLTASSLESDDESGAILRSRANPSETGGEKDDDLIEVWDLTVRLDLGGQDASGEERSGAMKGDAGSRKQDSSSEHTAPPPRSLASSPRDWHSKALTDLPRSPVGLQGRGSNSASHITNSKSSEKLYRVLLALDDARILLIEPLEYSRPMYFESQYIPDEKNYWSGRSVSYNLQGLQEVYNLIHSALYNAVMTQAMPLVIGSGLPEKFTRYGWGDVLDAKDMVQTPWAAPSVFQGGQALMVELQNLERIGDQTARVSQNTMGSVVGGDTTATEQSIVAAGVTSGQEEYIANFSAPFGEMAEATMELLDANWGDWYPRIGLQPVLQMMPHPMTGEAIPMPAIDPMTGRPKMNGMIDLHRDDLRAAVLWETTGKTPGNTPQAKMQAAQLLLQAASNLPQTGGDVYELFKVLVRESGLNADGVQQNRPQPANGLPGSQGMQPQMRPGMPPQLPPGIMPSQMPQPMMPPMGAMPGMAPGMQGGAPADPQVLQ